MERLKPDFPVGMSYDIVYDPTRFVQTSIQKVIETLFIAVALVVLVVILFLQTWRASIIPLIAVPVSIVGTFAFLLLLVSFRSIVIAAKAVVLNLLSVAAAYGDPVGERPASVLGETAALPI